MVGGKFQAMAVAIDDISIGYCCLMLVLDTILYTCLAIYLENVWPGEYGVRKPFYYILIVSVDKHFVVFYAFCYIAHLPNYLYYIPIYLINKIRSLLNGC